jgi:hypothetical protein
LQSTIHSAQNQLADLESGQTTISSAKSRWLFKENQLSGKQNSSKSLMQREARVRLGCQNDFGIFDWGRLFRAVISEKVSLPVACAEQDGVT